MGGPIVGGVGCAHGDPSTVAQGYSTSTLNTECRASYSMCCDACDALWTLTASRRHSSPVE